MTGRWTVRDPIHGFIELQKSEVRILDHPAMQRLRGIKQLAMAFLAFPGATHTRFDHSLGVISVAARLAHAIGLDPAHDSVRELRLAAMCHDVGHGPFSHISEFAFASCADVGSAPHTHESITQKIVQRVLLAEGLLKRGEAEAVCAILAPTLTNHSLMQDVVNGPLDADKLDYLLRDSYFAGVRYGIYDLDRLLDSVVAIPDPSGASYMGISAEDVPAVDQFVLARANMRQVYYHKVRRITDAMLVRAVAVACDEGNPEVVAIYRPQTVDDGYIRRYMAADDHVLTQWILSCTDTVSADLMSRLTKRQLVKEVFREPIYTCGDPALREKVFTLAGRSAIEQELANCCSKPRSLVFVDVQQGRPLRKGAGEAGIESISVVDNRRTVRNYEEVSPVFRSGPHRDDDYISVYMPADGETEVSRLEERAGCRKAAEQALCYVVDAARVEVCSRCGNPLPAWDEKHCRMCGQRIAYTGER